MAAGPAFPNCAGNRDANGNPTQSENAIGEHSRYIVHYGRRLYIAESQSCDLSMHINDKVMHFCVYLTLSLLPVIGFRDFQERGDLGHALVIWPVQVDHPQGNETCGIFPLNASFPSARTRCRRITPQNEECRSLISLDLPLRTRNAIL